MTVKAKKLQVRKFISVGEASGELLHSFYRNHLCLEFTQKLTKKQADSPYNIFQPFLRELESHLDKNCSSLWSWKNKEYPTKAGSKAYKTGHSWHGEGVDGSLLELELFFESPKDMAALMKAKGLIWKLQS